jgi:hypothetical protein
VCVSGLAEEPTNKTEKSFDAMRLVKRCVLPNLLHAAHAVLRSGALLGLRVEFGTQLKDQGKQNLNGWFSLHQFMHKLITNFFRHFVFGVNDQLGQLMIRRMLNEVLIQLEQFIGKLFPRFGQHLY